MTRDKTEPRPLRILHLVDSLRVGGKERQVVELLKGLNQIGSIKSIVVTMGTELFYVPDIQRLGVPLFYLVRRTRWDITVFWRLWRILREFRPHILHTNSEMAMSYAWPLTRLTGTKIVNGTIRNAFTGKGFRWHWHKVMLRLADARVANCRAGFTSRGWRHAAPRNYVIYNGFDIQRFETHSLPPVEALGFNPEGRKVIGMVAEFSDHKDFATFIRAAKEILARRQDVIFVAVGDGKHLKMCKQMISPAEQNIRFLGQRKDVEALVQQIDIGVLCTFTEGISNSVMEYMAAGKPVVVTDGGGTRELIRDRTDGFLVPASNSKAVAEKVELLLNQPALARTMGAAGRRRIQECFSLEQLVEDHLDMYRDVLERL